MTKRFRPWEPKQKWLLPPESTEFIPEGHASPFVRDLVVEQLDLSAILATYVEVPRLSSGNATAASEPRGCVPEGSS
jgi:hypothetical protein